MKQIADYEGALLNHLNLPYRAGDRALAIELIKALDLTVVETKFTNMTLISAHPNAENLNSEIAQAVLSFVSDESVFCTSNSLVADDGHVAGPLSGAA
jgi:hypothetical protein